MNESKIYVGNLSYDTSENELRDYFTQYGNIEELKIIIDHQTGRSKGFGFITYTSSDEGKAALSANGSELGGRKLNVNTAKDNNDRRRGGNGGGGNRW